MDAEVYRKEVERKILGVIEDELRAGKMDAQRAQAIAKAVLSALEPPKTLNQINQALPQLIGQFSELVHALAPILDEQEERLKKYVIEKVTLLIAAKRLEEAKVLIISALNHEVTLP